MRRSWRRSSWRCSVETLFQCFAAQRLFLPPLGNQLPELIASAQFKLFVVHTFKPNQEGNGAAVAREDDTLGLSDTDTIIKSRPANVHGLHKISSVVLCGGLWRTARTITWAS